MRHSTGRVVLSALFLLALSAGNYAADNDGTNGLPITQQVTIACTPAQIYGALTNTDNFIALTGLPATISPEEGGAFSLFGGQISGRHIELRSNERVVQAWRVADWPDGVYSVINFSLEQSGVGTLVSFIQSGFPEGTAEHLNEGWHSMYWQPLGLYCE